MESNRLGLGASFGAVAFVVLATLAFAGAAPAAQSWMWDKNANKIDDRIEAVETDGVAAAHVNHDPSARLIFFLDPAASPVTFGVYVGYDHAPADADAAALTATGAVLNWRPKYIPYLRARATFAQIQALAALGGVTRVEAWQVMYTTNDNATRALRARASEGGIGAGLFPSVWKDLGITGRGVVVGILDTGVNDSADASGYPGHESLIGKFVGGGNFSNPDPLLNTPADSSANPENAIDPLGDYHATHVAGTAIGSGGPTGILNGAEPGPYAVMAPDARLVDCKVLTDAGEGGGAAEALEWCIEHRNTVWTSDGVYHGIQVLNMSLGGATASDGTDADCAAVNAAVKAGMVVCVASGNDGNTGYMPSPAAADLATTVGAAQDANTVTITDDIVANYSNEGPRESDGDSDHLDEMKPNVMGSGSDILSALGDPTTNGRMYHNINGTSMATPCVAGVAALVRQANPNLSPQEVRDVLENTAWHRTDHGQQPPSAADPFGVDPNYHPSWGWGEIDAYAAVKEALDRNATQVVIEGAGPVALVAGHLEIPVRWTTQREVGVTSFAVWRAPDHDGHAGVFAAVSPSVAPVGGAVIERRPNRTDYTWTDTDPSLVPGDPYWYEVRWSDGVGEHAEPAFLVKTAVPPVRARVRWAISHTALDNDVAARFGSGTDPNAPAFWRACGGSSAADSSRVIVPGAFGDLVRYYFHADLTDADLVGSFLPPSAGNPWFLRVLEKGFVNTEGVVDSFSVTVFNGLLSTVYASPNPSTPTVEGHATAFWIPLDPATSLNHSPVIDPIAPKTLYEGVPLNFTVSASDPDGQALTYSATGLPLGASFDAGAHAFSWTPSYVQAGTYDVTFRATDTMAAFDEETVHITVKDRAPGSNTPPVLDFISDKAVAPGSTLSFTISATDDEDGPLAYSTGPVPSGSGFDPNQARFEWTPFNADQGSYVVKFRVEDSAGAADSQLVRITVSEGAPPLPTTCTPDTTITDGTIGVNVQGVNVVQDEHSFVVSSNTQAIEGYLSWTGAPAVDLDLYLIDEQGNVVASGATATSDPEHLIYVAPAAGTYRWRVASFDNPNPSQAYEVTGIRCTAEPVAVGNAGAPRLSLAQAAPNPFSRSCTIGFATPVRGPASLRIYNVAGRLVRTLVSGELAAGAYQRVWDGRDESGSLVGSGVYFYRLTTVSGTRAQRAVFVR